MSKYDFTKMSTEAIEKAIENFNKNAGNSCCPGYIIPCTRCCFYGNSTGCSGTPKERCKACLAELERRAEQRYKFKLSGFFDGKKISVIKEVRGITGFGLVKGKGIVEGTIPYTFSFYDINLAKGCFNALKNAGGFPQWIQFIDEGSGEIEGEQEQPVSKGFYVMVKGAIQPKHVHKTLEEAKKEAFRLFDLLPVEKTIEILEIKQTFQSFKEVREV